MGIETITKRWKRGGRGEKKRTWKGKEKHKDPREKVDLEVEGTTRLKWSIDNYVFRDSSLAISSFFPFLRCNLSRMNSGQYAWQPCLPTMLAKKQYTFSSKDSSFPMWCALYFRWIPMLNVEFRLLNFGFIFDRMRDEVKIFLTQQKKNYTFRSITFYRIERVRWHLHDNVAHASYNS